MAAAAGKSQLELDREKRIAENKRKIEELGLNEAAAALANIAKPVKRQRRAKTVPAEDQERRVSSRDKKTVNYCELESRTGREPKAPVDYTERIKGITLDKEKAEQLRQELASKSTSTSSSDKKAAAKRRGPVDSGKGVRIQGGRVYDSKHGVTCHWCRQKTLEDHVTCTNPVCGKGKRMPTTFCAKCLMNRHGEDWAAADASEDWWCPICRGSCGPGCVGCCNCGPCRKKAGLEPTAQVAPLARKAGFTNVHDYLVHLVTGESGEAIAARKLQHPWGAWLKGDKQQQQEGGSSDASEQTEGCEAGGCSHEHSCGEVGQEGCLSGDDAEEGKDQAPTAAAAGRAKKSSRAAKPPTGRKKGASKKASTKAKAAAAPAAAAVVEPQQQQEDKAEEEDDDVPMLSSQDATLSRKQRIMQCLGLAPVTVITKPKGK